MRIRLLHFVFLMFIILLIPLRCIGQNDGQKFRIMSVYPSPILIGGREIQANDTVSGSSIIEFSSSKQALSVVRCGQAGPPTTFNYALLKDLNPKNLDNAWERWENGKIIDVSNNKSGTLGSKGPESSDTNTEPYIFFNGIKDSIRFIPEKRLAIVIGNDKYIKLDPLTKPSIDAENMQNKLVHLGFDVFEVRDATKAEMEKSFNKFFKTAADNNYNLLLVYYSGHGVWFDGKDYLLPIDARKSNKYAEGEYKSAHKLLKDFHDKVTRKSDDGTNFIIILDACRNTFGTTVIKEEEEVYPKIKENELLFYAVSVGEEALQGDNDGIPSPFTKALIDGIGKGENTIYDEFYDIKYAVKDKYLDMNPTLFGIGRGWFEKNSFVKKKCSSDSNTQNNEN